MLANKPFILGLTGGIGCGKSMAAAWLKGLGAAHVDADAISRELTAPGGEALPAIRDRFGDDVFNADGSLDRAALGQIVFESAAHRRALEGIIHPLVQRRVLSEIQEAGERGERVVVLDVPLLFETGMDVLCDETWAVTAGAETQLIRVMSRGLTAEQAQARIDSQMSAEERSAKATRTINTDRSIDRTQSELTALYQQLLKRLD
ncbi:MAG: dephospho-CoA kinase [Candidatus Faecivicinus sp.]